MSKLIDSPDSTHHPICPDGHWLSEASVNGGGSVTWCNSPKINHDNAFGREIDYIILYFYTKMSDCLNTIFK